ncbi:MAG TPA: cell envelope integrity protein TolA, partial [Methylococcaceae bacterium]|nr:cell envelope integrity protein TolA [Methylococcaceae bacterium]
LEAKKRAEAEAKKQAAEEQSRQQQERIAALNEQMEAERQQEEDDKAMRAAIRKIKEAVERRWLKPPSASGGMSCKIQVRTLPGGEVVDVRIIVSSGDAAFDNSADLAVRKASPLPLPSDARLAGKFRSFNFEYKP